MTDTDDTFDGDAFLDALRGEVEAANARADDATRALHLAEAQLVNLSLAEQHCRYSDTGEVALGGDRAGFGAGDGSSSPDELVEDTVVIIDCEAATVTTVTGVTYRFAECRALIGRGKLARRVPDHDESADQPDP